MRCPFCGHDDSQVKDSRPSEDNSAIRRRRHCPECGGRFTTFERVQLRELIVIKKSGRRLEHNRKPTSQRRPNHSRWSFSIQAMAVKTPAPCVAA